MRICSLYWELKTDLIAGSVQLKYVINYNKPGETVFTSHCPGFTVSNGYNCGVPQMFTKRGSLIFHKIGRLGLATMRSLCGHYIFL